MTEISAHWKLGTRNTGHKFISGTNGNKTWAQIWHCFARHLDTADQNMLGKTKSLKDYQLQVRTEGRAVRHYSTTASHQCIKYTFYWVEEFQQRQQSTAGIAKNCQDVTWTQNTNASHCAQERNLVERGSQQDYPDHEGKENLPRKGCLQKRLCLV